ncbi:MAG: 16S rRNA (cytosine(967)-C(5))-methyltransferase RsmB, partial [Chromatiales bacterium]|nr:16S rRNA (cytosine(967)-C(5))-methyltransferase RsmB [Chromatiales bacterium]
RQVGFAHASALVNAILRRFQREREALLRAVDETPEQRLAYPKWMVRQVRVAWPDHWEAILSAGNAPAPLSLRINTARTSREDYCAVLDAAAIAYERNEYAATGLMLQESPPPQALPGFADGWFAVQDCASQLIVDALNTLPGDRILDACAAPGGKSGAIAEALPETEVVSLDINAARTERMRENFQRLGLSVQIVDGSIMANEAWWDGQRFSHIVMDVPCTATGIIRRQPDIKHRRREGDAERFAQQSLAMLEAAWAMLANGGTLVYATCSLMPAENSEVVSTFVDARTDATVLPIDASWGIPVALGRQILPGEGGMDGFYYARLVKA